MVSASARVCLADVSARLSRSALQAAGWTSLTSQHFLGASLPKSAFDAWREPNHKANDEHNQGAEIGGDFGGRFLEKNVPPVFTFPFFPYSHSFFHALVLFGYDS